LQPHTTPEPLIRLLETNSRTNATRCIHLGLIKTFTCWTNLSVIGAAAPAPLSKYAFSKLNGLSMFSCNCKIFFECLDRLAPVMAAPSGWLFGLEHDDANDPIVPTYRQAP
jgi:hypothetical protein